MKKSDLKKLITEYRNLRSKSKKDSSHNHKMQDKLKELEHRYFHETGRELESDLEQQE